MCFGRARLEKSVLLGGLGETEKTTFYPSLLPNEAPEGQGRLTRLLQGPMLLIGAGYGLVGPGLSCLRGEIVQKIAISGAKQDYQVLLFSPIFRLIWQQKEEKRLPSGPRD